MGRPIRRSTLSTMANEYESRGNLAAPKQGEPQEINPGAIFYGVNWGDDPIMPGDRLRLLGFNNAATSYKYAYRRLLNGKNKLAVRKWKENDPEPTDSKAIFQAITPAALDRICKFKCTPSEVFFANVYGPPDGESPRLYQYITINGVGTDDKDEAFAYWGPCSLASDPDQQGGRYYVALCAKIQEEGLSLEEVDDEIDAKLTSAKILQKLGAAWLSKTVLTDVNFTIDANGYLSINPTYETIQYIGRSN